MDLSVDEVSSKNKQLIAIDWSNSNDYTSVSSICGNCGFVLGDLPCFTSDKNIVNCKFYKKCPKCGIKFKEHKVLG